MGSPYSGRTRSCGDVGCTLTLGGRQAAGLLELITSRRQVATDEHVVQARTDKTPDDRCDDWYPEIWIPGGICERVFIAGEVRREPRPEVTGRVDGVPGGRAPRHADGDDDQADDERGQVGPRWGAENVGDREDQEQQDRGTDDLVPEGAPLADAERRGRQRREHSLGLLRVAGVERGQHLGVVPAHDQRGNERAEELRQTVWGHLPPREALERGQRDGDRRVEVGAADTPGRVHAEHDTQAPCPVDGLDLADLTFRGDDLCYDTAPEEDEDQGPGELGDHFTRETVDL